MSLLRIDKAFEISLTFLMLHPLLLLGVFSMWNISPPFTDCVPVSYKYVFWRSQCLWACLAQSPPHHPPFYPSFQSILPPFSPLLPSHSPNPSIPRSTHWFSPFSSSLRVLPWQLNSLILVQTMNIYSVLSLLWVVPLQLSPWLSHYFFFLLFSS